jgi:tRNA-Thr(GGU) m(6)t(6)A37 methyltransferase TsaA
MNGIELTPIGTVRSERVQLDVHGWSRAEADILLDPDQLDPEATLGLADFSHVVVVFHFHRVETAKVERGARHPRGRRDWPRVGVLAQRNAPRPNRLGVSICRLLRVEGLSLRVQGLDAVDGTPVLDVKPHMLGFLPREEVREPAWAEEILRGYW